MSDREPYDVDTEPGGVVTGAEWSRRRSENETNIFKLNGGLLENVDGTNVNAWTADIIHSTRFPGYSDGLKFQIVAPAAPTGALTLAIQGEAALPVRDKNNAVMTANTITVGMVLDCVIDSSIIKCINIVRTEPVATSTVQIVEQWPVAVRETAVSNAIRDFFEITDVQGESGDILVFPPFIGLQTVAWEDDAESRLLPRIPDELHLSGTRIYAEESPALTGEGANVYFKIDGVNDRVVMNLSVWRPSSALAGDSQDWVRVDATSADSDLGDMMAYKLVDDQPHDYAFAYNTRTSYSTRPDVSFHMNGMIQLLRTANSVVT